MRRAIPKPVMSPDVVLAKGMARSAPAQLPALAGEDSKPRSWRSRPARHGARTRASRSRSTSGSAWRSTSSSIPLRVSAASLQGYRLVRGRYQPIPLANDGTLLSRATGLRMKPEGLRLRLIDVATGEPILWPEEAEVARWAGRRGGSARRGSPGAGGGGESNGLGRGAQADSGGGRFRRLSASKALVNPDPAAGYPKPSERADLKAAILRPHTAPEFAVAVALVVDRRTQGRAGGGSLRGERPSQNRSQPEKPDKLFHDRSPFGKPGL